MVFGLPFFGSGWSLAAPSVVGVSVRPKPVPWLAMELSDGRAAALVVGGVAFVGGSCVSGVGRQSWLRGWHGCRWLTELGCDRGV